MQVPFPTSYLIFWSRSSFGVGDQIAESSLCLRQQLQFQPFSFPCVMRTATYLNWIMRSRDPLRDNLIRALELLKPALVYESLKQTAHFHTSYNWLYSLYVYHDKYGSSTREIRLDYNAVSRQNSAWEVIGRNPLGHHVAKEELT